MPGTENLASFLGLMGSWTVGDHASTSTTCQSRAMRITRLSKEYEDMSENNKTETRIVPGRVPVNTAIYQC